MKQILGWAAVAFAAFYVLTQPQAAGHLVHEGINGLRSAGNSIATFLNSVSK